MKNSVRFLFCAAVAVLCAWNARADSVVWQGVTVDYGNADISQVDDELILQYKTVGTSSLAILDGVVKARLLVVGGGGSGSSGGSASSSIKIGYGGKGGEVVTDDALELLSGDYAISVGKGGVSVNSSSSSRKNGSSGDKSSFSGSGIVVEAAGGGGGGTTAATGTGTSSSILGKDSTETVIFGKDGATKSSSGKGTAGESNTGNGGQGGYNRAASGAGGSGIVIVRLTAAYAKVEVPLKDLTLGTDEEVAEFAERSTGVAADIFFGEVMSASFAPEGVARGVRTKDGRFAIVGLSAGETTVAISLMDEVKEKITTYTAKVTVTSPILLKDLLIQRGETTASLVFKDADAPVDFDYDEVKALRPSVPEIADFVKLPNGKIGVIGKVAGVTEMSILTEGQSYRFAVTVEKLLSGLYKAGACEVAVTNASEVRYVDGDLVLIYRNVDAAVKKSFGLPKATIGRLLAVGGGGAGGQDAQESYSDRYGLPGGGGAGGLVINDSQSFEAATYEAEVGAGGGAFGRRQAMITVNKVATKTWVPTASGSGSNGVDTVVRQGSAAIVTAKGGGGGGCRSEGKGGGSGGGGSASSTTSAGKMNGGSSTQTSSGFGSNGGAGNNVMFGAGGGGAGGPGGSTTKAESSLDPTNKNVDGSGKGGPGKMCDITGETLEYARGGAGGVPRVYPYYYSKNGVTYYTKKAPTDTSKFDGGKYFWSEASDGKPGRDGYGDGGGGSGHFNTNPTFAGRGGDGAVIVRIPPYRTTVEDALKAAFVNQPVTVSGNTVTLTDDVTGGIGIADDLGEVTVNLSGHAISGAAGAVGDDITAGGDGQPALRIVAHDIECGEGATKVTVTGTGALNGGSGGEGHPQGRGASAVAGLAEAFAINPSVAQNDGTDGGFVAQHPHDWRYSLEGNAIYADCVAEDGATCSYRERRPVLSIDAVDADFTGRWYEGLTLVNTITEATGVMVPPPTYEGIEGTVYAETSTAPVDQGRYRVKLTFRNLTIYDTFAIVEAKADQDLVYKSWKTATRNGDGVDIRLTATFSSKLAINDGNVLFLGSRCNAHSMATGTVEKAINAMAKYADVRWYAYGSSDPTTNRVNQLTRKGEVLSYADDKGGNETVHLIGGNHFVYKEMMDDLYAELVEKKNLRGDYDLIVLEFDGNLLGREGVAPYQLNYGLPDGWNETKAAQLRAVMETYYKAGRVVWLVPDVNQPKSDAGYTGEYPWRSNPEFIWQRAFLRATETEGYQNPYQKNYEDADHLVNYISDKLIGAYFQMTTISDTVKAGLKIESVTPQVRDESGFWMDMMKVSADAGAGGSFTLIEPLFGVEIKATVSVTGQKVETVFDMGNVQQEAVRRGVIHGNDLQVKVNATIEEPFFEDVALDEWKETNEGLAFFTFGGSLLSEEFAITTSNAPPKIQNTIQPCVFVKPPLVSSGKLRELIGVPWQGPKGTDIALDDYIVKDDLAVGDMLFAYDLEKKAYNCYALGEDRLWHAAKTIVAKDGEVIEMTAPEAATARVPVGTAAWLERQDASKPIVFVGYRAEEKVEYDLKVGYSLISAPGTEPFGISEITAGAKGDRVILPQYGNEPLIFTREEDGWSFMTNEETSIGGEKVVVPTKVTDPSKMMIPPGFGFWYEKK